jgi:hypothetical protein
MEQRLSLLTEPRSFQPRRTAPSARHVGGEVQLVDSGDPAEGLDPSPLLTGIEELALDRLGYGSASTQASPARADTVRVVGSVAGRNGQTVAGVLVTAGPPDDPYGRRTRTDDLGAFVLDALPASELSLNAFSPRQGRASEPVEVLGGVRVWEPVLDPGETWSGLLAVRGGELPRISRVEWVSADKQSLDVRVAALSGSGRVDLTNLASGWGALVAATPWTSLPWVLDAKETPRMREREVRVDARDARTGELRLRVRSPPGDVEVRVWALWKAPADRGAWMHRDDRSDEFVLAGLPRGRYAIEVGSPSTGWVELGPVGVAAGETLDLGTVDLPAPAHVRRPDGEAGSRWLLRRDAVETLAAVFEGPGSSSVACPAGSYLLLDPDDRARGFAFELQPGESVVVSDEGVLSREPRR